LFIPVILSGGAGTRLWPVSRESHPKPFMRLQDGMSLLQKTLSRAAKLNNVQEILTVTNSEYYFKTKSEYAELNHSSIQNSFLLEPFGRNTAAAIGMAAFYAVEKYGPDSVLLILPADHLIENQAAFQDASLHAYQWAKKNKLVTFGIKPTIAETGFGYIKMMQTASKEKGYLAERFVEKPHKELAEQYVASGDYLWNSGMFCFTAETILTEMKNANADIFHDLDACWKISKDKNELRNTIEIDSRSFEKMANLSIDYAVMEKSKDVVVIPCDFSWNDIGSWSAVSDLITPDDAGNRVMGDALLVDVENSFIKSDERLIAAAGVKNLIVIDTPDALLIADRHHAQDVKKIVDQLKQNNHDCYKIHRTVVRPWGTYTTLEEGPRFKIKRIVVKPGASLSLQMHHHRNEHWVVVSGMAGVTNGETVFMLNTNESTFIPAGHQHRLENPGLIDLVLIEVQTGDYLGEDDIVRFEDKYGRT